MLPIRKFHADTGTMDPQLVILISGLFEHQADSPFFIKDRTLAYVASNPAMARLCGARNPAAMLGKRAAAFFPRTEACRYEALDLAVIDRGLPVIDRFDLASGHGAPAWLLFSRLPVRDDTNAIVGVAASARRLADAAGDQIAFPRLAMAVACLESRLDQPLNLKTLASEIGISLSQLERDFTAAFGMPPQRFVHKLRIERALALLAGPTPVAEIALACGYTDQSAFTRRFGRVTGTTPSAYRRRLKAEELL